jgi:hypothetical protein
MADELYTCVLGCNCLLCQMMRPGGPTKSLLTRMQAGPFAKDGNRRTPMMKGNDMRGGRLKR